MSTVAEANRHYFDHISDAYDEKPWFALVDQKITHHLRSNLDWVGIPFANTDSSPKDSNVRLLDYACGPGRLSQVYAPYVTMTRGIDISPNMVATYNARARSVSLPHSAINAVVGDLFDKSNPLPPHFSSPEWKDFDLVTAGFAFHHFEDVVHAAKTLKERLRPGGALVISDFLEGGDLQADENGDPMPGTEGNWAIHNHSHGHGHGHGHGHEHKHEHGKERDAEDPTLGVREEMKASIVTPHFTFDFVRNFFTEAGFVDIDVVPMKERVYMEFAGIKLWRTVLFAKGIKPTAKQGKSEL
ncbi:S-adenosyl-L-methionine-dependent methyltransferase [Massarina eburnea CBS 473.64]|uniref:S-adenosyl-L-methionine-dependent methyltransferase n=1 Tax=Massarina eburnea CBS 473.64 TaxID=1395130 RepID=A0A6A6RIY4_9PLEO|nr:S-adenosyl-L-methionine-dependent methyltransferase [Massarina eburnea CBS 473.64]